jgi:hypothetical protein
MWHLTVGAPAAGAAISGGLGAATGLVVGNELQNREVETHQTQSQVNSQQSEITQQRREIERLKQEQESE